MLLSHPITHAAFAEIVGIDRSRTTQLVRSGLLTKGATGIQWLHSYCANLREQAAQRMGGDGVVVGEGGEALDLVQERARLARSQCEGHAIRNASLRGTYAPRPVLERVLGMASEAVAQRIAALDSQVAAAAPNLPAAAAETVGRVVASAAAEWQRATMPHLLTAASTEEIEEIAYV